MKKSELLRFTSASLIATLLAPVGCSTHKVTDDDESMRRPTSARTMSQQRERFVSSLRQKRQFVNLKKKSPREAIQYLIGKRVVGDGSASETAPPEVTSPWVAKMDDSEIQSCLTAVCGPATEVWSASSVFARPGFKMGDISPSVDKIWQTEFDSKLVGFYQRKLTVLGTLSERLDQVVKKGIVIRADHPFLPYLSFLNVVSLLDSNTETYLSRNSAGQIVFNEDAAKADATLSPDQLAVMKLIFEKFFLPLITDASNSSPFDNILVNRLKAKYPKMNLVEAQKKDAQILIDQMNRVSGVVGSSVAKIVFDDARKSELTKAAKGAELSAAESTSYVEFAFSISMMNQVYFDADTVAALKKIPFDTKAELAKYVSSGSVEIGKVIAKAAKDGLSNELDTTGKLCKMKLSASMELNASDLRYRKILEATGSVRTAAKSVVAKLVDPTSLEFATTLIDGVKFTQPSSNDERIQSLRDGAESEERTIRTNEVLASDLSAEGDQMVVLMSLKDAGKPVKQRVKEAVATELFVACDELPIQSITDSTMTSRGRIAVSWYSANYPEYGVAIMAHEMGHMVSAIIRTNQHYNPGSDEKFSQVRNCVANRNPYLVEPKSIEDMEQSTWVEEDWADRFSGLVMDELDRTHDVWAMHKNFGCSVAGIADGVYKDNKMNPAPDDTHSSGLFRLLMMGTDHQNLPNQCKSLLIYAAKANRQLQCN